MTTTRTDTPDVPAPAGQAIDPDVISYYGIARDETGAIGILLVTRGLKVRTRHLSGQRWTGETCGNMGEAIALSATRNGAIGRARELARKGWAG